MKGHIRERSPGKWAIILDLRDPDTGKPGQAPEKTVIDWSRRVLGGNRIAVSVDEAHRQAASCRGLSRDTL